MFRPRDLDKFTDVHKIFMDATPLQANHLRNSWSPNVSNDMVTVTICDL
jgi:hypothetical protein